MLSNTANNATPAKAATLATVLFEARLVNILALAIVGGRGWALGVGQLQMVGGWQSL